MTARNIDFTGLAYLAALAAGGFVVYRLVKAAPATVDAAVKTVKEAGAAVIQAVNPTDENNLANRGVNAIARYITGDPNTTAGLAIERLFKGNPDELRSQFDPDVWDRDDADLGRAARTAEKRGESLAAFGVSDQDDADQGRAMAELSGAAFFDYSKLRRGVFH